MVQLISRPIEHQINEPLHRRGPQRDRMGAGDLPCVESKPRREIRAAAVPGEATGCAELPPPDGSREYAIPWAIIAAVVAVMMPPQTRIRAVVEAGLPGLSVWALEGRRDHFGSHRLR